MKKTLFIIVIFLVLQVIFLSQEVALSSTLTDQEKKAADFQRENQQIEIEIASLSSFSVIAEKANNIVFRDSAIALKN